MKAVLIHNPVAGVHAPEWTERRVAEVFGAAAWDLEIHRTRPDESITGLVHAALRAGANVIIAAGGDGTVSAVVNGMCGTEVPLAILPVGTGNALARELGCPLTLEEALRRIIGPHELRVIDLMQIGEQFFALNISVGLSTRIMSATPRATKRVWGMLAYVATGLAQLAGLRLTRFKIKVDGRRITARAAEVLLVNGGIAGFKVAPPGPPPDHSDGLLNLYLVRARTIGDFLTLGVNLLLGRQAVRSNIRVFTVSQALEISTRKPVDVQADGDLIGTTPLKVILRRAALKVIV